MKPMSAVIKHLKLFDRKERFILLSKLLGMEDLSPRPWFCGKSGTAPQCPGS